MRNVARYFSCLLVVALAAGSLWADAAYDTVTLKDGRVLKGQVVEERRSTVVMLLGGVHRSFGRDLIAKISYSDATDPAADLGPVSMAPASGDQADDGAPGYRQDGPSPTVPAMPQGDLFRALSQRYRVPVGDVVWVSRQGVPDADLSLVFLVAATARVTPRRVVKLYLQGWSWDAIENSFQMRPDDVYYEPDDGGYYPYYVPVLDGNWYGWGWGGYGWGGGYGGGWGGYRGGHGYYGGGHVGWGGGRAAVSGGGRVAVGGAHAWGARAGGRSGAAVSGGGSRGGSVRRR